MSKVNKEEEEDVALASKKHPKKKKDLSKIKCFQCDEMGHFSNHCPEKEDKEASSSKVAVADDGFGDDAVIVRTALNAVTNEWELFSKVSWAEWTS